ncbi:hypothetical protein, partial [Pantoea agglomerans]|uniref:hypothetical protein n=1 Tax=Enterobacter agglomerans TaxID=549 RepID=UPI001A92BBEA
PVAAVLKTVERLLERVGDRFDAALAQLGDRRLVRLGTAYAAQEHVETGQHMRIEDGFVLRTGAGNLGVELSKRFRVAQDRKE